MIELRILPGDIVVQDTDAGAGAHCLRLADGGGDFERRIPATHDFAGEIQRGGKDQVFDIADARVQLQRFDAVGEACLVEICPSTRKAQVYSRSAWTRSGGPVPDVPA